MGEKKVDWDLLKTSQILLIFTWVFFNKKRFNKFNEFIESGKHALSTFQDAKYYNFKKRLTLGKYSDYKGVSLKKVNGIHKWICRYKTEETRHDTEREAAVNYDKKLIKDGREPKNILKRKID